MIPIYSLYLRNFEPALKAPDGRSFVAVNRSSSEFFVCVWCADDKCWQGFHTACYRYLLLIKVWCSRLASFKLAPNFHDLLGIEKLQAACFSHTAVSETV